MFSKRSIRTQFLFKLLFASVSLIIIFSSILYFYIENSIYEEKHQELIQYAQNIVQEQAITAAQDNVFNDNLLSLNVELIQLKTEPENINLYEKTEKKKHI